MQLFHLTQTLGAKHLIGLDPLEAREDLGHVLSQALATNQPVLTAAALILAVGLSLFLGLRLRGWCALDNRGGEKS